ncbi:hypothetical protein QR680_013430 [Steinernema hermaphroditum]|uniref:T20D4.11-like domain-containing protein n=1 Tax=Steinernema hermaphroditum TaxID=289476 RepID=A0AA39I6U6_9BILA|nr:hypothetical protein QR680_013430 [Steinernema hermaphroditum]
MILRLPLLLAVLLLARGALSQCPSSTFTCRDGSCIPQDWVGDGEADCDDGFDEENPAEALARGPSNATEKIRSSMVQVKMEQSNNDPFDELATKAPEASSTSEAPRMETRTECSDEDQMRVNRCVPKLEAWLGDLGAVDFGNVSLLRDEFPQILVAKGCDLVAEYHACIDGVSPECRTSSEVESWEAMEMYACQLLLPAAKEHAKCFAFARDPRCSGTVEESASPTCALVRSVNADIDCVERLKGRECDDSALEVLTPLRSETEHMHAEIQCSAEEQKKPQKQTEEAAEAQVNALRMLVELEATCVEPDPKDPWAPVKMVICHKKERLALFRECFEKALEESRCRTELQNRTACGAIDGFNANVDCSIALLNDVCDVEAQNVIVEIQERLNDDAIVMKCYSDKDASSDVKARVNNDGFELEPQNPRCSSEQENAALVCLVELVELNKQLTQFQSVNFLLEISSGNSSLVNQICLLYDKYEKCLNESVFAQANGRRCSFNSPLNTLARIGLSPICAPHWRELLVDNHDCLDTISRSPKASQCQNGLQHLGRTVNMMLQGLHGEALLCKSFYLIRSAFECGEVIVQEQCSADAVRDLDQIKNEMTTLGMEEGCPQDEPADLDRIITQPVLNATPMPLPEIPKAPVAHALPPPATPQSGPCDPAAQKAFIECVQPLTAFQPHPLAVIKQPKQIDEACRAFKQFQECRREVHCNPLWAKGMAAMFDFACGTGYNQYLQVRQCVRRITTRTDVRECVNIFSKGAPQQACPSSKQLLVCAKPAIVEKCGAEAGAFVTDYVHRFASAIDLQCRVRGASEPPASAIRALNCSASESQLVERCAAPVNEISARLEDLFKGGLQSLLKNVNNLAPIFAQGCNLTTEFRQCAKPALESGVCVVSSCLLSAGNGICDQPDVAAAIDANLGCVFQQVHDQEFGKCLRTTLSTLKEFNLDAIRAMLPRFVDCVEPLVRSRCGATPINVLKAITSRDVCPIAATAAEKTPQPASPAPVQAVQAPACSKESKEVYGSCAAPFYKKYRFLPIALINDASNIDDMCTELSKMTECVEKVSACEKKMDAAIRDLMGRLCASRDVFDQHKTCLATVAISEKVNSCNANLTSRDCASLAALAQCSAAHVKAECGKEALEFSYSAMNDFARSFSDDANCSVTVPSVALETGCSEDDLIEYLQCESLIDHFAFRPISVISNASEWNAFCEVVGAKYRPCLDAMKCHFEPVSSANAHLFDGLCHDSSVREKQLKHLQCLANYAGSSEGRQCLEHFNGVDLIAQEAPQKLCSSLTSISSCSSEAIASRCGADALSHVFNVHMTWAQGFDPKCSLPAPTVSSSTVAPVTKVEPEQVADEVPASVQPEPEPTPEATTLIPEPEPKAEPEPTAEPTAEPAPEPKAEPEPEPKAEPEPTAEPKPEPAPKSDDDNRTAVKPTGSSASTVSAFVSVVLASLLLTL